MIQEITRADLEVQVKESESEAGGKENTKSDPGRGRGVVQLHTTQADQPNQQACGEKDSLPSSK